MKRLIATLAMVVGLSRVVFAPFEQIPDAPLGSSSNPIYVAPSPYNAPQFYPPPIQTQPVIVPTPAPQPNVVGIQPQPRPQYYSAPPSNPAPRQDALKFIPVTPYVTERTKRDF